MPGIRRAHLDFDSRLVSGNELTKQGTSIMKRTLYEVLGVDREASAEEIAAAYRKRIEELTAAPSQDNSALALARDARDILSDTYLRTNYDASLVRPAAPATPPEQDETPEQTSELWLRQHKWPVAAAVLLLICIAWFALHRPSPRIHKAPAKPVAAEAAAEAAEEEAPAAEAARSPKDIFNEVSPSVVRINVMDGASRLIDSVSGVVIEPGIVITNCHVAVRGTTLGVKVRNEIRPATVQVADEALNLCRLSVPGLDIPPVQIGSVWTLRTGQRVLAIGAPVGIEASMKDGVVSTLAQIDLGTVIHTTAQISPGWSGGGLFDMSGHLVGITTYHHPFGPNINVALPADWITQMQARSASPASTPQQAAAAQIQDISAALIAGRWVCFGSVPGRNGDYTFRDDGRVLITTSEGRPSDSRYSVAKRALQFNSGAQTATFNIESLTPTKMVWQVGGADNRVVCDRR
jgi:S1-C subfamily serine protease